MVMEGIVLGHKIFGNDIEVDKTKIEAIERIPPPRDIKGIRCFLGHAGYYRRFIKNFSKVSRTLTNLLQKDACFDFNDECFTTFYSLKQALLNALVIKPPDSDKPFELICEARDSAIGATLGQHDGNNFNIIHHATCTLNEAQRNYSLAE
jgi:hypothetical protein